MKVATTTIDLQRHLSDWYMAIVELDLSLASELKEKAELLIQHSKPDDQTQTYYRLIDFRYKT